MKSKTAFVAAVILLTLGIALFVLYKPDSEPRQTYPATVNRDCAPWDGGAFTVPVQYDPTTVIYISIWKSPDIEFPVRYELPDDAGQVGNAYIIKELDPYTMLNGEVFLNGVSMDEPVEGRFRFTSERGEVYEGQFSAAWGDQIVYCG